MFRSGEIAMMATIATATTETIAATAPTQQLASARVASVSASVAGWRRPRSIGTTAAGSRAESAAAISGLRLRRTKARPAIVLAGLANHHIGGCCVIETPPDIRAALAAASCAGEQRFDDVIGPLFGAMRVESNDSRRN
jgi:hypothetical protein